MRPPHEAVCPSCSCDPDPPCKHTDTKVLAGVVERCLECGMRRRVAGEWYWMEVGHE